MKVQVLYFSKGGNSTVVGDGIARHLKCKSDTIPPAYPAESEKLVFVGCDFKGKPDKKLVDFCKTLTPARCSNVAFFVVSKDGTSDISELKNAVTANGVCMPSETFNVKGKFFMSGRGKPDQTDIDKAIVWADNTIKTIMQN